MVAGPDLSNSFTLLDGEESDIVCGTEDGPAAVIPNAAAEFKSSQKAVHKERKGSPN